MKKRIILILLVILIIVIVPLIYSIFSPKGEIKLCVAQQNVFNKGRVGYELLDIGRREVWLTPHFTPEEYKVFSFPIHWFLWFKNDPRKGMASSGRFLQSPGCNNTGQYSYMKVFDKNFLKVVELKKFIRKVDDQGLIRGVELEKYHELVYEAGRSTSILHNPNNERFILVARTSPNPQRPPTVPQGWIINTHILKSDIKINLSGRVIVLHMDNKDSYQGPLPVSLIF
jgi:hypothetical protein